MRKSSFDAEFDVVVVGGGSAGCVLSARLTENPKVSLCVIEAGGRDRNPWIHIPMGFGKLVPNPKMNWGYETEPEPGLGGRTVIWPGQGFGRLRFHQRPRLPARRTQRL
jgi:choline dehydrogenase